MISLSFLNLAGDVIFSVPPTPKKDYPRNRSTRIQEINAITWSGSASLNSDQSMERGCEMGCVCTRVWAQERHADVKSSANRKSSSLDSLHQNPEQHKQQRQHQTRESAAPKGFSWLLTLIAQPGSGSPSAQQHVVCGFDLLLPFFFFNRMRNDAN